MRILAHHTCDSKGDISDIAEIEAHGPFLSTHTEPHKPKMLGTGYYFFDNNIDVAHAHGKNRYKRNYHIFEAELQLDENIFLDLVGNRQDMKYIQAMMQELAQYTKDKWTLGSLIEFLKQKNKEAIDIGIPIRPFPFKAIRALDYSVRDDDERSKKIKEDYKIYFNSQENKYINLQPVFIVCLLENDKSKNDKSIVQSFKHKFTK